MALNYLIQKEATKLSRPQQYKTCYHKTIWLPKQPNNQVFFLQLDMNMSSHFAGSPVASSSDFLVNLQVCQFTCCWFLCFLVISAPLACLLCVGAFIDLILWGRSCTRCRHRHHELCNGFEHCPHSLHIHLLHFIWI